MAPIDQHPPNFVAVYPAGLLLEAGNGRTTTTIAPKTRPMRVLDLVGDLPEHQGKRAETPD